MSWSRINQRPHRPLPDGPSPPILTPRGTPLSYASYGEALQLVEEIFVERTYFKHGIHVSENSTVLDVGANIGIFALACAEEAGGRCRIICFEPVDANFRRLKENVAHLPLVAHRRVGIGAACEEEEASFTYYAASPGESSRYPEERQAQRALLAEAARKDPWASRAVAAQPELLSEAQVPPPSVCGAPITTLSAAMAAEQVDRVDVLKIDAEGDELEVLRGVDTKDWPRIGAVVVEVHDIDGRLGSAVSVLASVGGFDRIVVERQQTRVRRHVSPAFK